MRGVGLRWVSVVGLLAIALALMATSVAGCSGDGAASDPIESPPDFWVDIAAGTAKSDGTYGRVAGLPHSVTPGSGDLLFLSRRTDRYNERGEVIYAVRAGSPVTRRNRIGRSMDQHTGVKVTINGTWSTPVAALLDDRHITSLATYLDFSLGLTSSSTHVLVTNGQDSELLRDEPETTYSTSIIEGAIFIEEVNEQRSRCYRGSLDELVLVFQGHHCQVTRSGHVMGIRDTGWDSEVSVRLPSGKLLYAGTLDDKPIISDNGRLLISQDDEMIRVEELANPKRVWYYEGTLEHPNVSLASHPDGHVALVIDTPQRGLQLIGIPAGGEPVALRDLACGRISSRFTQSGRLFWSESVKHHRWMGGSACEGLRNVDVLKLWEPSTGSVSLLRSEDSLEIIGVVDDSAITATMDEFGAIFLKVFEHGMESTLLELDDTLAGQRWGVHVEDDYLYVAGHDLVAIAAIREGQSVISRGWCDPFFWSRNQGVAIVYDNDKDYGTINAVVSLESDEPVEIETPPLPQDVDSYFFGDSYYFSGGAIIDNEVWASFEWYGNRREDEEWGWEHIVISRAVDSEVPRHGEERYPGYRLVEGWFSELPSLEMFLAAGSESMEEPDPSLTAPRPECSPQSN